MKTPHSLSALAIILPSALLLSQCAPSVGPSPESAAAVSAPSQHWVKVAVHPPTFYPRGVAADIPTGFKSGDWIVTGDAQDTRYFIPAHDCGGIPRQTLLNEALAARSGKMQRQIAAEDLEFNVMRVILAPIAILSGMCPI